MSDYIKELRLHIGSRPLVMCGAGTLLVDDKGRILLILRTDNNTWGIPGGALEPGEYLKETARRELKEETGIIAGELELFNVFSGPELFYQYPNGDQVYNVVAIFSCSEFRGIPQEDEKEYREVKWFAKDHFTL